MELIKISENNGVQAVSARELYNFLEATERFSNWIERQFQYGFIDGVDYVGCKEFNTLANQYVTNYVLTIDCAKEISMLQKSEKGKQARQYFIECEKKLKLQIPDFSNPAIAARAWADEYEKRQIAEQKVQIAEKTIEEQQPKVNGYNHFLETRNNVDFSDFVRISKLNMGRNKFMEFLRNKNILMHNNTPYQKYLDLKYFEVVVIMGSRSSFLKTEVTKKGVDFLFNKCIDWRLINKDN